MTLRDKYRKMPWGGVRPKPAKSPAPQTEKLLGPVEYLNSYYHSPTFKQRYEDLNGSTNFNKVMSNINWGENNYKMELSFDDKQKSEAFYPGALNKVARFFGRPTVTLNPKQINDIGFKLQSEALPHEYTHTTRGLTDKEEGIFTQRQGLNKNGITPFRHYRDYLSTKNQRDTTGLNTFSNWMQDEDKRKREEAEKKDPLFKGMGFGNSPTHDYQPAESYADLNSVRYLLYKEGIYDTKKGPMTQEHLDRINNNPTLKGSKLFNRFKKTLGPDWETDLMLLNNKIAKSKDNTVKPFA